VDTSKEFITMCKKAKEIQQFNWGSDGDFSFYEGDDDVSEGIQVWLLADGWYPRKESFIWLPRQDQLSEMILTWNKRYSMSFFENIVANSQYRGILNIGFDSIEKHLLAFVMYEKYSKQWDGWDWIKIFNNWNWIKAYK